MGPVVRLDGPGPDGGGIGPAGGLRKAEGRHFLPEGTLGEVLFFLLGSTEQQNTLQITGS